MEINLKNIFIAFLKISTILLGGGYVIIPIAQSELVEKRNWVTKEEILDYYSIAQCLGGIIAVNMAILIGCKLKGAKGALTSVLGMSLPPFLIIVLIANLIEKIVQIPNIDSFFWGVNLAVVVLIYLAVKEVFLHALKDILSAFWFVLILVLACLKVNPVVLILSSLVFGLILARFKKEVKDE